MIEIERRSLSRNTRKLNLSASKPTSMVRPRPSLERQSGCIRIPFDSATFDKVLGDAATVVPRSSDKTRLADITCFKNTLLDSASLNKISALIKDKKFRAGTVIMAEDRNTEPALYLVRSGKCEVTSKGTHMDKTIMHDGFFGEDHMTMDVDKKVLSCIDVATLADLNDMFSSFSSFADFDDDKSTIVAQYTVQAIEDTICGVLSLDDCRSVIDTTKIGQAPRESKKLDFKTVSKLDDLNRHQILGQGEFGQVWLVSVSNQTEIETPYALKIQPKYELTRGHQAKGAMREMEIMSELNHPFLLKSLRTFQDENLIYMLLEYIPGGELYSRVHTDKADGLPESEARFYGAGILEALSFLHRRKIVYRDLKPENVLIDNYGYAVITDFGFAKHVPDETFTRCGSPCYTAPEVFLVNVGYGIGADYWSLGCVIHEMVTGDKPFVGFATELALCRAVCSGYQDINPLLEDKNEALDLVQRLLEVDPSKRLGGLAGGLEDIFNHPWFNEIDFDVLRDRGIPAPWKPTIKNRFDVSYFEDMSDLEDITTKNYPEITISQRKIFENSTKFR